MTCSYCGSTLPADAMFCGECGRAVTTKATSVAAGAVCEQCGASVTPDDIFCGECGFVVPSRGRPGQWPEQWPGQRPEQRPERQSDPRPRDTNSVERLEQPENVPIPDTSENPENDSDDVDPAGSESRQSEGERFVLQFSTGESFTVDGSGLVGRSPRPEPGEFFDQLIRVVDSSRSVSKTHLEFGQDAGSFWVKDRYSGNGTIVREPDAKPVRCHPDRRYRLVRGSRVDLGEQFFIVS